MKNLNLENYGVQEMNVTEMMEVDGGAGLSWLAVGAYIIDKWTDIKKGFSDGFSDSATPTMHGASGSW